MLQGHLLLGASIERLKREPPDIEILVTYLGFKDAFANTSHSEFGFGVVNGDCIPQFIECVMLAPDVHQVALGTDGYLQGGMTLTDVEAKLQKTLHEDPLLIHELRAPKGVVGTQQAHDDRAFVLIQRCV